MAEESLCSRCAALGSTCCQGSSIFLTCGDVERVRCASGRDDFYEYIAAVTVDKATAQLDPIWGMTFGHEGGRRVLRHAENGDCIFLTVGGCALSMTARPLICRLYPFEYTPDTITGVHAQRCLEPERSNAPLLLALLGMNRETADVWRKQLYKEILEEFE